MANTYHQIHLQLVFAVKYRHAIIENSWKSQLQGVIGNLIKENNCKPLIVNGVEDHIHCLVGLRPAISVSDLLKSIKAKSSKYVNDHALTSHRFEWQDGYGAFSYSHKNIDAVFKYIQKQEEHHKTKTFKEEYLDLLKEFEIAFDEQYIFQELL